MPLPPNVLVSPQITQKASHLSCTCKFAGRSCANLARLTCDSFHGTFGEFYEAIILTAIVSITSSPCKKRVDELPNHLAIILKLPQYANDITFFC